MARRRARGIFRALQLWEYQWEAARSLTTVWNVLWDRHCNACTHWHAHVCAPTHKGSTCTETHALTRTVTVAFRADRKKKTNQCNHIQLVFFTIMGNVNSAASKPIIWTKLQLFQLYSIKVSLFSSYWHNSQCSNGLCMDRKPKQTSKMKMSSASSETDYDWSGRCTMK